MKIMEYVTYSAHRWVDKLYLKKHKVCEHSYHCECKKNLLAQRKIDRPFVETPIRDPQLVDGRPVRPSATDEEILIRVGLLASTLISANHPTTPAIPTYIDKYTTRQIRTSKAFCQAWSGKIHPESSSPQACKTRYRLDRRIQSITQTKSQRRYTRSSPADPDHKHTSTEYRWLSIAQLVERWTLVGLWTVSHKSLVQIRQEKGSQHKVWLTTHLIDH